MSSSKDDLVDTRVRSGQSEAPTPSPILGIYWASLVAQIVKTLPAMQETRVLSMGGEDPLEKEIVIHSRILA